MGHGRTVTRTLEVPGGSLWAHRRTDAAGHRSTDRPISTGVVGLGPVGRAVARAVMLTAELDLVAVVDNDPKLAGRPLRDLVEVATTELTVTSEVGDAFERLRGGVLLQATGSRLSDVAPQIHAALGAGVCVVSACPELCFPWLAHPEIAAALDHAALRAGVSVLGTGVNPGFALDRLVASAGVASGNMRSVRGVRVVDIARRRPALLRKAGVGLSLDAFRSGVTAGEVGHLGLMESAALAAFALRLDCDRFEEAIEPVVAVQLWDGPIPVSPGQVAGYTQQATGWRRDRAPIKMELTYALHASDRDEITIEGEPPVHLSVHGGISGALATAWSMVNAAPSLVAARPGLLTVVDLPPRSARSREESA